MSQSLPANLKVIGRYTILRELRRDLRRVDRASVVPGKSGGLGVELGRGRLVE
jgi:hypothetical protein